MLMKGKKRGKRAMKGGREAWNKELEKDRKKKEGKIRENTVRE